MIIYNTSNEDFLYLGTRAGPGDGIDSESYPQHAAILQLYLDNPETPSMDSRQRRVQRRKLARLAKAIADLFTRGVGVST